MSFWEFLVEFFSTSGREVLTGIMAAFTALGAGVAIAIGVMRFKWWNLLYIPAVLAVTFLFILFYLWMAGVTP